MLGTVAGESVCGPFKSRSSVAAARGSRAHGHALSRDFAKRGLLRACLSGAGLNSKRTRRGVGLLRSSGRSFGF